MATKKPAPIAQPDGFSSARTIALSAALISVGVCMRGLVGWWAVLPLWVLQAEFICRVLDTGVFGRRVSRTTRASVPEGKDAFTWEEVAAHNSEESAWIAIDGSVYDITSFVDKHPGGREMILLAVGRDATDIFRSYHPFTDKPAKILAKHRIGSLVSFEHPIYRPDSGFYAESITAVKKYFDETGLDRRDPKGGFMAMTPLYVLIFGAFYVAFCMEGIPLALRFLLCVLMGSCQGMTLTGWMHDASHASIGHSERWWYGIGRFALDYVCGSSMVSWRNQHVMGHHLYTNVLGADPDLPTSLTGDARRLAVQQRWRSLYRYQHLYLLPLYGVLAIKSRVTDFTETFGNRINGPVRVNPIATQDYLRMLCGKFVWAFYRLVVPAVFCQALSGQQLACLFLSVEAMTGYWLAFNFQVSHISDDAEFLFSDTRKRAEGKCPAMFDDEWAKSQVSTTVDYGHGSPVAAYLSGALNYQTVHHLFPTVSQYHYPAITPIVMEVAERHGVPFNVKGNFIDAITGHVEHLRKMGEKGVAAELKLE